MKKHIFFKYMRKDRFLGILSNLHLENNTHAIPSGRAWHGTIYKIKSFLFLMKVFKNNYMPEAKCPFKIEFRVNSLVKSNRFG